MLSRNYKSLFCIEFKRLSLLDVVIRWDFTRRTIQKGFVFEAVTQLLATFKGGSSVETAQG